MKEYIEKAVEETNRVMYKWQELHKNNSKFKITEADVRSVFNGWFVRFLKNHIGYSETSRLLRYARLTITLSTKGYIDCLSFSNLDTFRNNHNQYYRDLILIFRELNYKSLAYSMDKQIIDERKTESAHNDILRSFNPFIDVNFENIKNIQFNE
jgi:hypothetical protein